MSAGPGRILLVDDEVTVLEVLGDYLGSQGYAVDVATDGEQALAAMRRQRPDLVLLDIRMPGIDGVETLRRLRELDASVPVIMVTANEDVDLARETLKLGAFDYIAKPFDFAYLDSAVAAGLVEVRSHEGPSRPWAPGDPLRRLARTVFRAVRSLPDAARASTGAHLERAALAAVRAGAAGRTEAVGQELAELELLVSIASELGDLTGSELAAVTAAIDGARRTLPPAP